MLVIDKFYLTSSSEDDSMSDHSYSPLSNLGNKTVNDEAVESEQIFVKSELVHVDNKSKPERINSMESNSEEDLCFYCQISDSSLHIVIYDHCGPYPIHQECLDDWIEENNLSCPICRNEIIENVSKDQNISKEPPVDPYEKENLALIQQILSQELNQRGYSDKSYQGSYTYNLPQSENQTSIQQIVSQQPHQTVISVDASAETEKNVDEEPVIDRPVTSRKHSLRCILASTLLIILGLIIIAAITVLTIYFLSN